MKDWKKIAEAHGLPLAGRDLDRVVGALDTLEETFRPLAAQLSPEMEPDTGLRLAGEDQ
jgi:hypothetical protein